MCWAFFFRFAFPSTASRSCGPLRAASLDQIPLLITRLPRHPTCPRRTICTRTSVPGPRLERDVSTVYCRVTPRRTGHTTGRHTFDRSRLRMSLAGFACYPKRDAVDVVGATRAELFAGVAGFQRWPLNLD